MARTVRDARLETRQARLALKQRHEPYWRGIEEGRHLGYRKGHRGGVWIARWYGTDGYRKEALGLADDVSDADGLTVLSFAQAQAKAVEWCTKQARVAAGLSLDTGPYTVEDAMTDYLAHYKARGRAVRHTQGAIDVHIVPALGAVEVASLTTARLRKWHHDLAAAPAMLRTGRRAKERNVREADTAEAKRRRQATANRILTVLKAGLNHAYHEGRVPSDDAWRKVKPFRDVDAPVIRYLSEAECVRLVNAFDADFRQLVRAALLTGCRYGEILALRVADYNPDSGTLAIRASKSGKARHVVLTDEGRDFFDDVTAGRDGAAPMFRKADGGPWKASHQRRPLIQACKRAKISPAVSFHVLRHTYGSILAMRGVPLAVISEQLGHADSRMTQKHYAHLAPGYVATTIRTHFPRLGITKATTVVGITR